MNETSSGATAPAQPKRGTRLPADWKPSPDDLAYATQRGIANLVLERTVEDFRDYWLAKPGQGGVKLDWSLVWRTWVRREADRLPGGGTAAAPAKPAPQALTRETIREQRAAEWERTKARMAQLDGEG